MITINEVQATMINRIKASDIPSTLIDVNGTAHPDEVRQYQWQGTKFAYPCIRVKVHNIKPVNTTCTVVNGKASLLVLGENPSALKINDIGSDLTELFHGLSWSDGEHQSKIFGVEAEQFAAERIEESGVWASEVKLTFSANKTS